MMSVVPAILKKFAIKNINSIQNLDCDRLTPANVVKDTSTKDPAVILQYFLDLIMRKLSLLHSCLFMTIQPLS